MKTRTLRVRANRTRGVVFFAIACVATSFGDALAQIVHVDWVTGSDTFPTGDGTSGKPYKTITKGLAHAASDMSITTIKVAGGSGAVHQYLPAGGGESFPLSIPRSGLTLLGTRVPMPVIRSDLYENLFPSGPIATILVDGKANCTIEHVRVDNSLYNKVSSANPTVKGIHVRNLPSGQSVTIRDCELFDSFHGIYVDDGADPPSSDRTVDIIDCLVEGHGPVTAVQTDLGHAGIRLLEAVSDKIVLNIVGCIVKNNHDGIEPGQAITTVRDTMIEENENGFEYAALSNADATIIDSCFRLNEPFDPNTEGGITATTGGIVVRGSVSNIQITVRNTDFDRNQIGVKLGATGTGTIDLGTSTSPGGNTFKTDLKAPWYQNEDYRVSYCGLFTSMDTQVLAVGNTWTYKYVFGDDPAWNQGVGLTGQFPTSPALTAYAEVNYVIANNLPPHRPLFGSGAPQEPWNYSTGVKINPSCTTNCNPSILLVP